MTYTAPLQNDFFAGILARHLHFKVLGAQACSAMGMNIWV